MSSNKGKIQSRSWCLTVPAKKYTQEQLQEILKQYIYIAKLERGEEKTENNPDGYEHYHIYIENPTPISFDTLKNKLPEVHIEKRLGTKQQAFDYVVKRETTIGEPFGNGEIDLEEKQGKRTDLEALYEMIMLENKTPSEVILEYPRAGQHLNYIDRLYKEKIFSIYRNKVRLELKENVFYIWGDPGSNKTRYVYDKYGFENVYRVTDYKNPFDEYQAEPVLVLDEFHSQLRIEQMLNILDIYPYKLPCRYSNKVACYTTVYIISNLSFDEQYIDIQLKYPRQFAALKRRISAIVCFNEIQTSMFDFNNLYVKNN